MSSRNRGQKTLTGEDEIEADSVNIVGSGLAIDGYFGSAHEVLQKDSINELKWKALTIAPKSITGTEIADATIEGSKLATDISISTTGNILTSGTGSISSINGNITCAGTGDLSVNSGDITTTSGKVYTNTIAATGTEIRIEDNISVATDKNISLLGTGGILSINGGFTCAGSGQITAASGNIIAGSGKLKGNTIAAATGSTIAIENNMIFDTDKSIAIQGTGTILTNNGNITIGGTGSVGVNSGNLATTSGKVYTNTIRNSSGSNITIEGDILCDTDKNIVLQGTGQILTNNGNMIITGTGKVSIDSGDIETLTGKLKGNTIAKSSGSTITIEDPIDCGSNNITTTGQVSAGTLSVSTFTPASITTTGDIETTGTGEVKTNTLAKSSGAVDYVIVKDNLVFATGKGLLTGTGTIETTSGAIATDSGDIFTNGGHLATTLLKGIGAGGGSDITCLTNIQMGANNIVASTGSFTSVSGHITNTNGNITATSGSVITNTIAKSSGSAISISDPINVNGDVVGINLSGTGMVSGESLTIYRNPMGGFHTIAIMDNLPTAATGLATGQIYSDRGTLKIA